ncbi:hypothetical protein ACHAWF_017571 [Thalassiosira exigua]
MPRVEKNQGQLRASTVREALAAHLRHDGETSPAFYYLISGDACHPFSVANRLGLTNFELRTTLVCAGLASINPTTGKLTVKGSFIDKFLDTFGLKADGIAEYIERTKVDVQRCLTGNRTKTASHHVLRIGRKSDHSPNSFNYQADQASGKMPAPPTFPGLSAWQRTLRRVTRRSRLEAIVDDETLFEEAIKDSERSAATDVPRSSAKAASSAAESLESPPKKARVEPNPEPSRARTGKYELMLSQILGTDFNPQEDETKEDLQGLALQILGYYQKGSSVTLKDSRNHDVSYVHIKKASSDESFRKSRDWLEEAIAISGSKEPDTSGSAFRIANHLFKYYKDAGVAAAEHNNVPICKPMKETQYAAMLKAMQASGIQAEEMTKHLRFHLGKGFLPPKACVAMLCEGHAKVKVGSVPHKYKDMQEEETIEYSIKAMDKELESQLGRLLQSKKIEPAEVMKVTTITGGDHGDVAFQFGATVQVETKEENLEFEMSLAEVLCRTDSAEIIEKTILGDLTKAMKTVATKRLHIYKDAEGKVGCCFGAMPDGASFESYSGIEVKMHVTGDLAFYAMALGRESMSGAWCFLCKLCRSQYADKNHADGEMWTVNMLKEIAEKVKQAGGKPIDGVKCSPWWDFLEVRDFIIPLLHLLIGIGNDLLDSFCDWVNEELESLDNREYQTKKAVTTAEHLIIDQVAERDEWDASADGKKLKSLKSKVRARKKSMEKLGALISLVSEARERDDNSPVSVQDLLDEFGQHVDAQADDPEGEEEEEDSEAVTDEDEDEEEKREGDVVVEIPEGVSPEVKEKIDRYRSEMEQAQRDLGPLELARGEITGRLSKTRKYLAELKKKVKSFRSDRRKSGEGLESKMFRVLKEIGVELTRYHGGSLNGKDIKTMIENATYVFDKWSKILTEGKRDGCTLEDREIEAKVNEYRRAFLLWDGAFSFARKVDPTKEDIVMFKRFVSAAVNCHTYLGCSITHKTKYLQRTKYGD